MNPKVLEKKKLLRSKRKLRVRSQCFGLQDKPRVTVFRSNRYFYAQAIDDKIGHTLASIDSRVQKLGNNKEDVAQLAEKFAGILMSKGIKEVVFDRNGYLYHGVVASFADGLRKNGIRF